MKKSTIAWMVKNRKKWERKSEKYRKQYEKSKDPKVLAAWFKVSVFALEAEWFRDAIRELRSHDELEAIKDIFTLTGQGKRTGDAAPSILLTKKLLLKERIDKLVRQGKTLTAAFEVASHNYFGETVSISTIKNYYYEAKKYTPEVYIGELKMKK